MDTLDSDLIDNSIADIRYKNGFTFGLAMRIVMACLGSLCLLMILSGGAGLIIGSPIFIFSIYALTSSFGTEISFNNGYVKEYSSSFGIKKGKWKSTHLMPEITILKQGQPTVLKHNFAEGATNFDESTYDVLLLSANHRKRMLLKICKSGKEALKVGQKLEEQLEKKLVQFNPKISQKTLARRYERH